MLRKANFNHDLAKLRKNLASSYRVVLVALIKTNEGMARVVEAGVNIKNIFHAADKFGISLGRNYPRFIQPRF